MCVKFVGMWEAVCSKWVCVCVVCECDVEECEHEARYWFSGKISRCHRDAPGSIPGWRIPFASLEVDFFLSFFPIGGFPPAFVMPFDALTTRFIFPHICNIFSMSTHPFLRFFSISFQGSHTLYPPQASPSIRIIYSNCYLPKRRCSTYWIYVVDLFV